MQTKALINSVIAVDRNYVPMMEVARRKAIRAVATGRAMVLNPANLDRHLDLRGAIALIIFPNAKAWPESKLLMGRLDRRVMKRDLLPGVQPDQGRPHPRAGRHAPEAGAHGAPGAPVQAAGGDPEGRLGGLDFMTGLCPGMKWGCGGT